MPDRELDWLMWYNIKWECKRTQQVFWMRVWREEDKL